MPVTPTYPGVYVEELSSGVRTITGVPTSITAFVGRAQRGPANDPTVINSYSDFERRFGGLQADYPLSYAVRDFYLNGGSQAIILRLYSGAAADSPAAPAGGSPAVASGVTASAQKVATAAVNMNTLDPLKNIGQDKSVTDATSAYAGDPALVTQAEFTLAQARLTAAQKQTLLDLAQTQLQTALKALDEAITNGADATAAQTTAKKAQASVVTATADLKTATDAVAQDEQALAKARAQTIIDAAAVGAVNVVVNVVQQAASAAGATPDTVRAALRGALLDSKDTIRPDKLLLAGVPSGTAPAAPTRTNALLSLDGGNLVLEAANDGDWANNLTATVDYNGITADIAKRFGLLQTDLFNLTVTDTATKTTETFLNVTTVQTSIRYIQPVLLNGSSLVRALDGATGRPAIGTTAVTRENTAAASGPLATSAYDTAFAALGKVGLFNLLCVPPDDRGGDTDPKVYQNAMQCCANHRALLIVDPPAAWGEDKDTATDKASTGLDTLGLAGEAARNAALYFPRVIEADPLRSGQLDTFVPCGIIAGVMARTDLSRGVWKAPAGLDAAVNGIQGLQVNLDDDGNGQLNPLGINCLRSFPVYGRVVWGARTLRGADQLADEYKYVPVRRTALFIEESLYRGLKWVVFEPNDEPLWAEIRLNAGAFMHNLFRQGAFQGKTPREAYFVKCDSETTTQNDIDLGIVNIVVGFAPLKPAEFVIIQLQQMAGQVQA